ncbi:protein DGCR6L isoform X2 [Lingula anatina]|uniref:Protein DGCR6L isoform X1 n=1 Tax=Lingula anatina TaxID=7574 RepID=A0A1S3IHT4_LINAN|nr:protein DGCR6L isoform X1 [Lingula anatina]XP_013397821.1 protein DGCR6L isoform X2 [Lingula anatina]|eukprot:XP_013397820.1 protein DGCR6L isoform X1 [Lingula anatina]
MEADIAKKEQTQKRHYFYLNELQSMARELPGKHQQRLSYDLLSHLANALLDGTVFAIVSSLKEVQQLEERNLFNRRVKMLNEHAAKKQELMKKQSEAIQSCRSKPHSLPLVQAEYEAQWSELESNYSDELKRQDMRIILELDQKMLDQQSTLEKAGVPGFCVTNNPLEVRIQMYLLDFINRISEMQVPD